MILMVMLAAAAKMMHDVGFEPEKEAGAFIGDVEDREGIGRLRLAHPGGQVADGRGAVHGSVGIYAYALQPYLLELYGDETAYQIAGLAAAITAGAQILGGIAAPRIRRIFHRRTSALIAMAAISTVTLCFVGLIESFWAVIGLIVIWGLLFAATMPIRQTYLNGLIPSCQRATIISFDSMMSSSGGVWSQPVLGRAADVWGYPSSYLPRRRSRPSRSPPGPVPASERARGHGRPDGGGARPAACITGQQGFDHPGAEFTHAHPWLLSEGGRGRPPGRPRLLPRCGCGNLLFLVSLQHGLALLAGANANRLIDREDEDLAVADIARPGVLEDRLDDEPLSLSSTTHSIFIFGRTLTVRVEPR